MTDTGENRDELTSTPGGRRPGKLLAELAVGFAAGRLASIRFGPLADAARERVDRVPWGWTLALAWALWLVLNIERLRHAGNRGHRSRVRASLWWEMLALQAAAAAYAGGLRLKPGIWLFFMNAAAAVVVCIAVLGSLRQSPVGRNSPRRAVAGWSRSLCPAPWRKHPAAPLLGLLLVLSAWVGAVAASSNLAEAVAHDVSEFLQMPEGSGEGVEPGGEEPTTVREVTEPVAVPELVPEPAPPAVPQSGTADFTG